MVRIGDEIKLFCECGDVTHVVKVTKEDTVYRPIVEMYYTAYPAWGLWQRIREAWNLIWGREVSFEVVLNEGNIGLLMAFLDEHYNKSDMQKSAVVTTGTSREALAK